MSNYLSVRRVKVQTLDENGNPEGEPTFGIMASDSYEQSYTDIYETFDELNESIRKDGTILQAVAGPGEFSDLKDPTGFANYYGPAKIIGIDD